MECEKCIVCSIFTPHSSVFYKAYTCHPSQCFCCLFPCSFYLWRTAWRITHSLQLPECGKIEIPVASNLRNTEHMLFQGTKIWHASLGDVSRAVFMFNLPSNLFQVNSLHFEISSCIVLSNTHYWHIKVIWKVIQKDIQTGDWCKVDFYMEI